jgi:hypothetical protein
VRNMADEEREELWAESVRRHNERRREQHQAAWYAHEVRMGDLHTGLAREHYDKAEKLLETDEHKESA